MYLEGKDGVGLRCNNCGAQMIIAPNALQASIRRRPSGWLETAPNEHACPLCSSAALRKLEEPR